MSLTWSIGPQAGWAFINATIVDDGRHDEPRPRDPEARPLGELAMLGNRATGLDPATVWLVVSKIKSIHCIWTSRSPNPAVQ